MEGDPRLPRPERRVMKFAFVHLAASAWEAAIYALTGEYSPFSTIEVMTVLWGLGGPIKTTHVLYMTKRDELEELHTFSTICPRCSHLNLDTIFTSTSHLAVPCSLRRTGRLVSSGRWLQENSFACLDIGLSMRQSTKAVWNNFALST